MQVLIVDVLAALPAYAPTAAADAAYLAALDQLVHAQPTSVHPTARAELLRWLVDGLGRDEWSPTVTVRAVQAIKGLGRNPLGSEVLATRPALETLVRCAALPQPLSSVVAPSLSSSPSPADTPRARSPTQRLASFLSRSSSPPLASSSSSSSSKPTSRSFADPQSDEALRVLANVALLHAPSRATLADLGVGHGLAAGLRELVKAEAGIKAKGDVVFVAARILFLLTVAGGPALVALVDESDLPSLLATLLADPPRVQALDPLPELLKLTYNVLSLFPRLSAARVRLDARGHVWEGVEEEPEAAEGAMGEWWDERLTALLPPILAVLAAQTPPSTLPLSPTLSQSLACLLPFPSPAFAPLLTLAHENRLLAVWNAASAPFDALREGALGGRADEAVEREMPVLALVLARLTGVETFKERLLGVFFPADLDRSPDSAPLQDRPGPLGRAVRLLLAPADMGQTRAAVGELLFALAERDPNRLCDLVGYGNAAGFLLTKGFSSPSSSSTAPASSSSPSPSSSRSANAKLPVNPITALEADPSTPTHDPTMTDADKEREAERLFVLFDRIRRNPAVSLGDGKGGQLDPVRSAVESGRFEEMDEDAEAERSRLDAQDAADEKQALREVQAVRARRGEGGAGAGAGK